MLEERTSPGDVNSLPPNEVVVSLPTRIVQVAVSESLSERAKCKHWTGKRVSVVPNESKGS